MEGMGFGSRIILAIFPAILFYILYKFNRHWFLKLSILVWAIFTGLAMLFDIGQNNALMNNPIFGTILAVFSIGFSISIFAAIGNAMKSSLAFMNIVTIILVIFLFLTGVGAPFAIAILVKGLVRENLRDRDKK